MATEATRLMAMCRAADALTGRFPVGTPVEFWTMAREGLGHLGRVRSAWTVLSGHTVGVWVEGHPAFLAATHVRTLADDSPQPRDYLDYLEAYGKAEA